MKKRNVALLTGAMMATALSVGAGAEEVGLSQDYAGQTISVVVCNSSFMEEIQKDIGEFEEATGINVEFESLQDSQVSNKVAVASAAGGKDLDVFGYRPLQESLLYIKNGWLEPLNTYFEDDTAFDYEDFFESAREITSQDGTAYGIPYLTEREILYLNTELIEKAGLEGSPKTYDELLEWCDKLNDPDNLKGYLNVYARLAESADKGAMISGPDPGEPGFLDVAKGQEILKDATQIIAKPQGIGVAVESRCQVGQDPLKNEKVGRGFLAKILEGECDEGQ